MSAGVRHIRRMPIMRITLAALVLLIQICRCSASNDTAFSLTNKGTGFCLVRKTNRCYDVRWTTGDRLLAPVLKKCLGVQGKSVGSEISLYDCDENSDLQKWECKNETLLALKGQDLYINLKAEGEVVLSKELGPNNHITISGTSSGACSRTYRELFTIGGNSFGKPCMFPFMYKDRWYADCTTADSSTRRLWCATETKYDHELWGFCPTTSPEHWRKNPITGTYYQINSQSALTWPQAQLSCKQQGATLLTITDPHVQAYVTGNHNLWIGLIVDQEHGWQWTDGRPFRYLRWFPGHPLPDPGHNCGVVDSRTRFYWQSETCSKKLGYICYKPGALPPPVHVETGFCSSPWIPYNGHCFHLQRDQKTWSEAQTECRKEGGDLASIHNVEDQSFVISQLGYGTNDELWIGLNDRTTEGLFDWGDHSTVTFTSWEFGKPSASDSQEDCVLIRGEKGNWADGLCEDKHGFICMKQSASKPTGPEVELNEGCKAGWRKHGSYCYFVGPETKTFDEAKAECKSSASYLADVSNGVDNAFLVSLVGMRPEKYFWLGLSNQKNIDDYVWTNANSVRFTHWNAEMPGMEIPFIIYSISRGLNLHFTIVSSIQGHRQGCVAMTTGIFAGLWDVLPCTNKEKYICKHLAEGAGPTPVPPTPASTSCVDEWNPVGSRSFCSKFFTGPRSGEKTWFEARDYCRAIGGDLLSIHSAAELRLGGRHYGKAWIGLSAPDPSTGYVWSDGSPLNFQHWQDGQPDNKNNVESCTEMNTHDSDDDGSWNDAHCESYNDWICQIRTGVTPKPPPNNTATDYNVTADGWLEWRGNQYYINHRRMAMEDARHYCKQRHGDLVVINSEAENLFLWKQVARDYGSYYIGLTVDLDGTFQWMDDSPVVFQKWDENQPDFKENDENCVAMIYHMGFWRDYNCGWEHSSICKRSSSSPVNTTVAPTVPPTGGCPTDWSRFDSKCYRIINNRQDTWKEARTQCKGMGGNLASILTRRVQVFLTTRMAEAATKDLWIGLNSKDDEQFYWTDGRPRQYTNWGTTDQCVVMNSDPAQGIGKWITKSCNDTNAYVCLQKVDPNIPVSPEPATPTSYVKVGNDTIKVVTENMSWYEARKHCEANSAKLASLRNEWTQAYVELQAVKLEAPLWIGLNKNETGGYFRYVDGWHMSLSNWYPGEPSRDRPCVYLDVDGSWKTAFCSQTMNSVCMQSTDVPPTESTHFPGVCPEEVDIDYSDQSYAWIPFRGHCYIFITREIEWPNAATSCVRHGGTLASIEDPFEQSFIKSNAETYRDSHVSFWIGLYKTHRGKWLWLDKTVMDYTNWGEDEPDSDTYGQIVSSDGTWRTGRRWHDRAYICKTHKAPIVSQQRQRVHTTLAVVLVIMVISILAVVAFFLYKKSGRPLPSFDNPFYVDHERSQPDVVDTNKLIENAEEENVEEENPEPIITL
ncbi:macrophage mannose receptor 1-like [Diretmus argenteus]